MFKATKQLPVTRVDGDTGHTADHNLIRDALAELQTALPDAGLVTPVSKSAAYTLALADGEEAVEMSTSTAAAVTVPTNATVAFPIGTVIEVMQAGAGQVTITPASGVTVVSSSTLTTRTQFSVVTLRKRSTNGWVLTGDRASAAAAAVTGSSRVMKTASGRLQVNGQPFRFGGPNIYWLALNDNATGGTGTFVSDADIRLALDQAVAMGATGARVHTLGISVGKTNTMMPALGSWNDTAVERADFVIAEAGKRALKLMTPTTDRWDYYHGGLLTLTKMVLGSSATLSDGYSNAQVRTQHKAYLSTLLNHVNRYNGLRWGDDPTLAFWETGNECYDMPSAFHTDISAHLKSLAPLALVADGTAASGMHVKATSGANGADMPGLADTNTDIVGGHFYDAQRMDTSWMTTDAAAAASAGKAYIVGEYDWTDTDNNVAKSRTSTTRAQWHAAIEGNPNVSGSLYWSLEVDKATVGTHRDGYELYADSPENSEQTAGRAALALHASKMTASTTATA
jgi:mannan endo-1,4-beta-mannosidase